MLMSSLSTVRCSRLYSICSAHSGSQRFINAVYWHLVTTHAGWSLSPM